MWERTEGWIVDSTRFHGPNMVRCEIVSVNRLMPIIGAYLPPSTLDNLPNLEESLNIFLGRYPVILGELNADTSRLKNPWYQQVSGLLAYCGMVDLLVHF